MNENLTKMNESVDKHKEGAVTSEVPYEPDSNLDDISDLMVNFRIKFLVNPGIVQTNQ